MTQPVSAEAVALQAVLDEDDERAQQLLHDFLPGELRALRRSLEKLDALIAAELGDREPARALFS